MRYEIEWSQGAMKDIRRLDKPLIARITRAIEVFAETGRSDVKRLTNADGRIVCASASGEFGSALFIGRIKSCSSRPCGLGVKRTNADLRR